MLILNLIGAYSELDRCLFWTWSGAYSELDPGLILNLIDAYSELDPVPILNLIGRAYSELDPVPILNLIGRAYSELDPVLFLNLIGRAYSELDPVPILNLIGRAYSELDPVLFLNLIGRAYSELDRPCLFWTWSAVLILNLIRCLFWTWVWLYLVWKQHRCVSRTWWRAVRFLLFWAVRFPYLIKYERRWAGQPRMTKFMYLDAIPRRTIRNIGGTDLNTSLPIFSSIVLIRQNFFGSRICDTFLLCHKGFCPFPLRIPISVLKGPDTFCLYSKLSWTLSLPRAIDFKFSLQPHHWNTTSDSEELGSCIRSAERWEDASPILTAPPIHFSLKVGRMYFFNLGSTERVIDGCIVPAVVFQWLESLPQFVPTSVRQQLDQLPCLRACDAHRMSTSLKYGTSVKWSDFYNDL